METAAEENIPYTRPKNPSKTSKRKSIPGWKEQVKPHQDKARFWYQVWLSADKLREGQGGAAVQHHEAQQEPVHVCQEKVFKSR